MLDAVGMERQGSWALVGNVRSTDCYEMAQIDGGGGHCVRCQLSQYDGQFSQ